MSYKAICAAEQFVFARYFMHRTVYYHKTTFGLEEAFRQLIRRCRDQRGRHGVPKDGAAVEKRVVNRRGLLEFTDEYLDKVAQQALDDEDEVIRSLAEVVVFRRPPKLLREVVAIIDDASPNDAQNNDCSTFLKTCKERLDGLATRFHKPLGLFLVTELPKPLRLEKRGPVMSVVAARRQSEEKEEELIKVFLPGDREPKSLVEVRESILNHCGGLSCLIVRLYVVEDDPAIVRRMEREVSAW